MGLTALGGEPGADADEDGQQRLHVEQDIHRASPASNRPVHWIMTSGERPAQPQAGGDSEGLALAADADEAEGAGGQGSVPGTGPLGWGSQATSVIPLRGGGGPVRCRPSILGVRGKGLGVRESRKQLEPRSPACSVFYGIPSRPSWFSLAVLLLPNP